MPGELIPTERPAAPEPPAKPERPARKRRPKLAAGTLPPPFEASKAEPREELEELPQALLKAEPPAVPPTKDTLEALETLKAQAEEVAADKEEWETRKDAAEAAAAASEERKGIVEARGKKSSEDMYAILEAKKDIASIPDMSEETRFEDPREESEHQKRKDWPKIAERHLKHEAEAMKAVESLEKEQRHEERTKKKWWERLRDIL